MKLCYPMQEAGKRAHVAHPIIGVALPWLKSYVPPS